MILWNGVYIVHNAKNTNDKDLPTMAKKQIELTGDEYELLLTDALIYEVFAEVLDSVVHDGENAHIAVTPDELSELIRYVGEESQNVPDRRLKKAFKALGDYLKSV